MSGWGDVSGSMLLGWQEKVFLPSRGFCLRTWFQLTEIAETGRIVNVTTYRRTV